MTVARLLLRELRHIFEFPDHTVALGDVHEVVILNYCQVKASQTGGSFIDYDCLEKVCNSMNKNKNEVPNTIYTYIYIYMCIYMLVESDDYSYLLACYSIVRAVGGLSRTLSPGHSAQQGSERNQKQGTA